MDNVEHNSGDSAKSVQTGKFRLSKTQIELRRCMKLIFPETAMQRTTFLTTRAQERQSSDVELWACWPYCTIIVYCKTATY